MANAKACRIDNLNGDKRHTSEVNPGGASAEIRILLFRESRLRDIQLIFDSLNASKQYHVDPFQKEPRNSEEFSYLTEIIFGCTAMKYQDTYYKIHDACSPSSLIFTQVFSTPIKKAVGNNTGSSTRSLTYSEKCPSSNSMTTTSLFSNTESFSLKRVDLSSNSTFTSDSGFSESSFSSSLLSPSYSSFTRRRSSASSVCLSTCSSFLTDSGSTKNMALNVPYSKLGLALILPKPTTSKYHEDIYIQHIPLIESVLWRIREYVEITLNSPRLFLSTMLDTSLLTAKWLSNELNLLIDLGSKTKSTSYSTLGGIFKRSFGLLTSPRKVFFKDYAKNEKFKNFSRTVEKVDVKETKFFLSTLLTATLAHHTGWIATCYQLEEISFNHSYHALWNQLTSLLGASGYLRKTSKTVIYGLESDNIINSVLDFLKYFIRFVKVKWRYVKREDILGEQNIVDDTCNKLKQENFRENLFSTKNRTGLSKINKNQNLYQLINLHEKISPTTNDDNNVIPLKLDTVNEETCISQEETNEKPVLFILGDNDELKDLKVVGKQEEISRHKEKIKLDMKEKSKRYMKLAIMKFPLPKEKPVGDFAELLPSSFLPVNGVFEEFLPDKIVQGTNSPYDKWKNALLNHLWLRRSCLFTDHIQENMAILGDVDNWDVQVLSSERTRMAAKKEENIVDASILISNMLDIFQQLGKSKISEQQCATFIEHKLMQICLEANALNQLLLTKDFCTLDMILNTLGVNIVDIPLLMSVGSNINPKVSLKYGLSYN